MYSETESSINHLPPASVFAALDEQYNNDGLIVEMLQIVPLH